MARRQVNRYGILRGILRHVVLIPALLLAVGLSFLAAPQARAVDEYSCGTYGAGGYGESCPETPPSSTPSPSTNPNTNVPTNSDNPTTNTDDQSSDPGNDLDNDAILLNDFSSYSSATGVNLDLIQGQTIYFIVDGVRYSLTINSITDEGVVLAIDATNMSAVIETIKRGETLNYDVNKDGVDDIAISYTNRTATGVSLTFWQLSDTENDEQTPASSSESSSLWWLWLLIAIIAGIVITSIIIMVKRRKSM